MRFGERRKSNRFASPRPVQPCCVEIVGGLKLFAEVDYAVLVTRTLCETAHLIFCVCLIVTAGCNTCDEEEPCERADYPLNPVGITTGVAGVAYYQSDVISDGCRDCSYETYTFSLWKFESDPTNPDIIDQTLSEDDPDEVLQVDSEYGYPLDPAFYMMCTITMPRSCAVFEIAEGQLWTVHLQGGYASPSVQLKVFGPDEQPKPNLPFVYPAP